MNIDTSKIQSDVNRALEEDIGSGDVTAELLPKDLIVQAEVISREPMVVCGGPWLEAVFKTIDPEITVDWLVEEGQVLNESRVLCRLKGVAQHILTGERSALNFLQTLSATATRTYLYVQQLKATHTQLLDTRKTLPGLRYAQKYAVSCGGGTNHRFGLYDAFLIKENHIKACGSVRAAVNLAKQSQDGLMIEIEVETLEEYREALDAGPDRILLDNFTEEMLREAVAINQPKVCELEASGGVQLSNIKSIAKTGVDFISVGDVTKSIQAIDLTLLIPMNKDEE